jgi:hypothetical protein
MQIENIQFLPFYGRETWLLTRIHRKSIQPPTDFSESEFQFTKDIPVSNDVKSKGMGMFLQLLGDCGAGIQDRVFVCADEHHTLHLG